MHPITTTGLLSEFSPRRLTSYDISLLEAPLQPMLPDLDMVEDGLIFKQCVRDRVVDSLAGNQQILASDEETQVQELLSGFSKRERKKILK